MHVGLKDHFNIKWNHYLVNKLKEKRLNAEIVDNDILIDGYKFLGGTQIDLEDYVIYISCVGIKNCPELIKNICLKPSTKVPRGLDYYGISTAEVKKWYLDFVFYFK